MSPAANVYFGFAGAGDTEEIKCEIDPTFTYPDVVSLPCSVREILAVHMSGCDSTVVVEYSLSDFGEADCDICGVRSRLVNQEFTVVFRFTLAKKRAYLSGSSRFYRSRLTIW